MNTRVLTYLLFSIIIGSWSGALAQAQEVTLTSPSGGLSITGTLLEFDGDTYQVDTDLGRITISNDDLICQGQGCPEPVNRLDTFSLIPTDRIPRSTVVSFLQAYAKGTDKSYAQTGSFSNPETVEISNQTDGLESVVSFKSDVINLGFSAKDSGAAVAFDAVQIISSSPVLKNTISAETLQKIWTGQMTSWKDLGGPDKKIRIILPIYADDLFISFERFDPSMSRDALAPSAEYFLSPKAITEAIHNDPLAIGLVYETKTSPHTLSIDVGCSIIARPTDFSIQSLEYPFAFQLNLGSSTANPPKTAQLIQKFASNETAQAVFSKIGLIPLVGRKITPSYQGKRYSDAIFATGEDVTLNDLQDFTTFSKGATRLATTLYFAEGEQDLDAASDKVLSALIAFLEKPEFAKSDILLAGYSDSVGNGKANLTLSKARADLVKTLLADVPQEITTIAFGEAAPIGCNDTDFGRFQNRRIEVWIQD